MKFEPTFVFAALIALAVLGFGITGGFISNSPTTEKCVDKCKQIISESIESCFFNGTYFKKDFFANSFCAPELRNECLQQFCRPAVENLSNENLWQCEELCKR